MHMWVLTKRHGRVLLEDKATPTLTKTEDVFLQFCATKQPCIINTLFWNKGIYKYTWYRDSVGQRSIIDFCVVLADLFSSVVDVCVKRRTELFTDHHLAVCILIGLNHSRTRKKFKARRTYRIKRFSSRQKGETHFCNQSSFPVQKTH